MGEKVIFRTDRSRKGQKKKEIQSSEPCQKRKYGFPINKDKD